MEPNLEDIDEYPEVREVGPEVGSPSVLLKMGGKETGWPAWIPDLNPIELLTLDGGEPDLLLALLKLALKHKRYMVFHHHLSTIYKNYA